jgi:hypothetical protein
MLLTRMILYNAPGMVNAASMEFITDDPRAAAPAPKEMSQVPHDARHFYSVYYCTV